MIKSESRSQKAFKNTVVSIIYELITLICGLILPRLILSAFGSSYNGLTSSISQFISVISLMKAGISGVTRAALYKPLAEGNNKEISEIVSSTQCFMRRVALLFLLFTAIFACVYPFLVKQDFSWGFAASLVIIISLSTFVQYYFGITYQMLLAADQREYIVYLAQIMSTVINTLVASLLIYLGASIHIVKLGSALAFAISPLLIYRYSIKHYSIDKKANPNMNRISQRWDAFGHELANFVNSNTDIIVITFFLGVKEVSVYTVYSYVILSIRKVVTNLISSFGAAFGNMFAKNEKELLHENLGIFELIVFSVTAIVYGVTLPMITPFALLYTHGVTDISYNRPLFGYVITIASAFTCYRIPYYMVTTAAGHYKQTRNGSFLEAIINIVVSIVFVLKFGIVGVAIGTLVAAIFRSTQFAVYMSRNILIRRLSKYFMHVIISILIIIIVSFTGAMIGVKTDNWGAWIEKAALLTIEATALTLAFDLLLWKDDLMRFVKKGMGIFKYGSGKKRGG